MVNDILIRQLETFAPKTVLAVGHGADALVSAYCRDRPGCDLTIVDAPDAVAALVAEPATRRYDFGLTAGYLECVDKMTGGALMARLRDVLVRRLCVVVPARATSTEALWTEAELTAFGFSFLEEWNRGNGVYRIYGFDIASYKKTPDWLNPRHWANPERWGKDRW